MRREHIFKASLCVILIVAIAWIVMVENEKSLSSIKTTASVFVAIAVSSLAIAFKASSRYHSPPPERITVRVKDVARPSVAKISSESSESARKKIAKVPIPKDLLQTATKLEEMMRESGVENDAVVEFREALEKIKRRAP